MKPQGLVQQLEDRMDNTKVQIHAVNCAHNNNAHNTIATYFL